MGLRRGLWRFSALGRTIDTVTNIVDEGSVVNGFKKTIKEDWTEDNPIGRAIYISGRCDGKKEGYAEASDKYEKKLLLQIEEFLNQKKDFEKERAEYDALLDECEAEIDMLIEKLNKTEAEKEYLQQLLLMDKKLRKIAG